MPPSLVVDAPNDLSFVEFGDRRLDRRARTIMEALQAQPSEPFPVVLGSQAANEGFYRFMANDKVEWAPVMGACHGYSQASARCWAHPGDP